MVELIDLAEVMHNFAPEYSYLERNFYWFSNALFDAVIKIFEIDNSPCNDDARRDQYKPIDPYNSEISGRWKGWRVSHTAADDLFEIAHLFKQKHRTVMTKVKTLFL